MDGNRLTISTPTDREVMLSRDFDAPPSLVFDALTKPELLKRWYGPTGWTMEVCEIDLRVGGKWRFVSRNPNGKVIGQFGVYHEIERPLRLVNTESWEDWEAGETLVTNSLANENGRTKLTSTIRFPSREVRDVVLKSGLEHGAEAGYQKLAEVLGEIQHTQGGNNAKDHTVSYVQ
jgi:uncharacterized protein YndB with AHSA1/START domain